MRCYAETQGGRIPQYVNAGLVRKNAAGHWVWTGKVEFAEHKLLDPLRARQPRTIFVNSMSDLGLANIQQLVMIYGVMIRATQHRFIVLTKRIEELNQHLELLRNLARTSCGYPADTPDGDWIADYCQRDLEGLLSPKHAAEFRRLAPHPMNPRDAKWPPPNVLIGVSAETQADLDRRLITLRLTPAALLGASLEPLLEETGFMYNTELGPMSHLESYNIMDDRWTRKLDWVVVGLESGARRREGKVQWIERAVHECVRFGCPVFVKQDNGFRPGEQGRIPDAIWAYKEPPPWTGVSMASEPMTLLGR